MALVLSRSEALKRKEVEQLTRELQAAILKLLEADTHGAPSAGVGAGHLVGATVGAVKKAGATAKAGGKAAVSKAAAGGKAAVRVTAAGGLAAVGEVGKTLQQANRRLGTGFPKGVGAAPRQSGTRGTTIDADRSTSPLTLPTP
eukprot:scaffold5889_cov62-Phaeocystis_antarctica.AAC.1